MIAAIGDYLRLHGGKPHFTQEDLESSFEMLVKVFGNLSRDIHGPKMQDG